jgi:hypothetical protein
MDLRSKIPEDLLLDIEKDPSAYIDGNYQHETKPKTLKRGDFMALICLEYANSLFQPKGVWVRCASCMKERQTKSKKMIQKERKAYQKANPDPKTWKVFEQQINMSRFDNMYCGMCGIPRLSDEQVETERNMYDSLKY